MTRGPARACCALLLACLAAARCPALERNPNCPCYDFKEGLFLECPGATVASLRNVLGLVDGTVQSLSIYDFDHTVQQISAEIFPANAHIKHIQFSQSHVVKVSEDAFTPIKDSLESLSIVSAKINKIPQKSLWNLSKLTSLDFQINEITELPENLFLGLHIAKLNLKGNKIHNVTPGAFLGLSSTLQELDMTENEMTYFPLDALKHLQNLFSLRLTKNRINVISDDSTSTIKSLTYLDLGLNQFLKLSNDFLHVSPNIKTLILFQNIISEVHEFAFISLTSLESLDMSHNRIIHLKNNVFEFNVKLKTVDLSCNHLHYITGVFQNLPHLNEAFLSENNILEITADVFLNSSSLSVLYLEQNSIGYIEANSFATLFNLTQLHMGTNHLTDLPVDIFRFTYKLTTISLDNNNLLDLQVGLFKYLGNLREIRLQNNKLTTLKRNVFSPLPSLLELHLQNNHIQIIESNAFITLKMLQHVNLQGNQVGTVGDIFPNRNSSLVSIQLSFNNISLLKNSSLRSQSDVQIMWLNNNQIKTISFLLLMDLRNVQRLYLAQNTIEEINDGTFIALAQLRYLDLSRNKLSTITNATFYNSTELEELNLHSNEIQTVATGAFKTLRRLRFLDLSHNKIKQITPFFMSEKIPIKIINVNNNLIESIAPGAFQGLNNVNSINLNNNNISSADFSRIEIPGLRSISLSGNSFISVSNKTFSSMPSLQTIAFSGARISQLPVGIFAQNLNLLRIEMNDNKLIDLNKDVFMSTTIVQEIRLQNNIFSEFPHPAFYNLSSLEILDLSQNHLTTIDFFKFVGLPNLKNLLLNNNLISSLTGFSSNVLKNLLNINLRSNTLTVLPSNFLYYSQSLTHLDLSFNNFKYIPQTILSDNVLPSLRNLNITSNPFIHVTEMSLNHHVSSVEKLFIENTTMTLITSQDFDYFPSLKELYLRHNLILRISPGAFSKLSKLSILDISFNKLENIPKERLQGLVSIRKLNFSHNNVRELDEFPYNLKNLQYLDLSFNHLSRLSRETFLSLYNLVELNLSGNWISTFSAEIFRNLKNLKVINMSRNYMEVIPIKVLRALETQIKTFILNDNPLRCDCEAQSLWEWINRHKRIFSNGIQQLRCEQPEDIRGLQFLTLSSKQLCDVPLVLKIAIQDIQPYSFVVSWQSRNHSSIRGFQVAYYGDDPKQVRGKSLEMTVRSTRILQVAPGTRYTVCVLVVYKWNFQSTKLTDNFLPVARVSKATENDNFQLVHGDTVGPASPLLLVDSPTSRCTTVTTIESYGQGPFSYTYMGFASLVTRRLSLIVGCCMGFVVFVVLVTVLGYMKNNKSRVVTKSIDNQVQQFTSYENFSVDTVEQCQPDICSGSINTISDKTMTMT